MQHTAQNEIAFVRLLRINDRWRWFDF